MPAATGDAQQVKNHVVFLQNFFESCVSFALYSIATRSVPLARLRIDLLAVPAKALDAGLRPVSPSPLP